MASLNDDNVQMIARFRDLEILQARRIELTKNGHTMQKSVPKLQLILQH